MKKAALFIAKYFRVEKPSMPVYKLGAKDVIFHVINITVLLALTLVCILPFYFLFVSTISSNYYVSQNLVTFWPRGITLQNYLLLFDISDFMRAFWITTARTVLGTGSMVLLSSFAGYLFANRKMWRRKLWYRLTIIPMYFNAGMIPWFLTMLSLGLTNTFLAYIIPMMIVPFNIILVKTYIESIPPDIEESAKIDGAGILTIFFKILLPLCIPILATIAIFGAVAHWNSLLDSLILNMNSPELFVLQHVLRNHLQDAANARRFIIEANPNIILPDPRILQNTIAIASALPIILVYPLLQRFFIKGMMIGAVKG